MRITKDTVVTLQYRVTDEKGLVMDAPKEPMAYLHGGYNNTLPKIEQALDGQEKGYQVTLTLAPEDAFGQVDPSLVRTIDKAEFPPGIKVGGYMEGVTDSGQQAYFRVVKIKGSQVMLDGNHAMAGKTLKFTIKVVDVRMASGEEIAHGHVHGAGGHHH